MKQIRDFKNVPTKKETRNIKLIRMRHPVYIKIIWPDWNCFEDKWFVSTLYGGTVCYITCAIQLLHLLINKTEKKLNLLINITANYLKDELKGKSQMTEIENVTPKKHCLFLLAIKINEEFYLCFAYRIV